jgi:hypothetical protein
MKSIIRHTSRCRSEPKAGTFNLQRRRAERRGRRLIGRWLSLPFALTALSLAAQTSPTNALPALAPAYGEMLPTFWERHGTALLAGSFLLLALAGGAAWIISRPKPPVNAPPEVLARARLAKLLGQPENGSVLSEISQTLRRYLLAAFGYPPGEWTTSEFSAALAGNEKAGKELAQAVSGFLRECDLRKFSTTNESAPLNAAGRALELIAQVEQRRVSWSALVPVAAASQTQEAANQTQASPSSDRATSGDGGAP